MHGENSSVDHLFLSLSLFPSCLHGLPPLALASFVVLGDCLLSHRGKTIQRYSDDYVGKKSRRNKAAKAAATSRPARSRSSPDQAPRRHGLSSRATPQEVMKLPLDTFNSWHCVIFEERFMKVLGIFQVHGTDLGLHTGSNIIGALPFIDPESRQDDLVQALFTTMLSPEGHSGAFSSPHRPFLIYLGPEFEPAYKFVKENVEAVGISVEMNNNVDVSQLTEVFREVVHQTFNMDLTTSHPDCSWHDGVRMGATVANVKKLPQNLEEAWMCTGFHDEENDYFKLVLKDLHRGITETIPPIGIGHVLPFDSSDVLQGILASMLAPMVSSHRRRPGRIVLASQLDDSFNYIREHLEAANVQVEMWRDETKTESESLSCAACGKTDSRDSPLMSCGKCQKVLYCGRACQRAHWKVHKRECSKKS